MSCALHHQSLVIAHQAYYYSESRARNYDDYLARKNWRDWELPEVPQIEIDELFRFIRRWDCYFEGNSVVFGRKYTEVHPIIEELRGKNITAVDLSDGFYRKAIPYVFDKVARCCLDDRFESTDASKILHTIVPEFFIMWDRNIRRGILGGEERRYGDIYVSEFLPQMQGELNDAIQSCMMENELDRLEAITCIQERCDGKTLAKLADQYNYMIYTMPKSFKSYIQKNTSSLPSQELEFLSETISAVMANPEINVYKWRQDAEIKRHQKEYRGFIKLLNELKAKNLINADEWRNYNRRWEENKEGREMLCERLTNMLQKRA